MAEVAEHRQYDGTLSRNAERMLLGTLRALRDHRPGANATPEHKAAYRARANVKYYLDRLFEAIVDDVKHARWRHAARGAIVFARHLPEHPAYVRRRLGTPYRLAARSSSGLPMVLDLTAAFFHGRVNCFSRVGW